MTAPLAGRRLYFVGIGGAGLSAYANFARAWGAEVRGWDARETIFLQAENRLHTQKAILSLVSC
jgi:UDP-N-acetylmuramate-alanine ligase